MATEPVAEGQRYRDVRPGALGPLSLAWIVDGIFTGTDGIEYARLSCTADPSRRKTLSLAVLADRRRFRRADGGR